MAPYLLSLPNFIQSAVLKILSIDESCADLSCSLFDKCLAIFPVDICGAIEKQVDWLPKLEELRQKY